MKATNINTCDICSRRYMLVLDPLGQKFAHAAGRKNAQRVESGRDEIVAELGRLANNGIAILRYVIVCNIGLDLR
jgi:hypothetical protein